MLTYSLTATSITVMVDFKPRTIASSHLNFPEIVRLARQADTTEADIRPLLDVAKTISTETKGNIRVENGKLFFKGFELRSSLATTILGMIREGNEAGAEPLKLFLEKAFANPDPRAATDLFDWVLNSKLPITPDGDILAWKAVRDDYLSIHSGTSRPEFDHHVGNTVEEDRTRCDPNPDQTCSRGLHFAAPSYLKGHYSSGGNRVVAVAISPTDVVAFPRDYAWAKGRASKYVVVGEVPAEDIAEFYPQGQRVYRGWAKPAPKTPGESKVGDVWQDRAGREATIVRTNGPNAAYPVQTDFGLHQNNGRFLNDSVESTRDLVKFVR